MTEVTLYTRAGYHLCDSVEQVIAQVARSRSFRLTVRDIDRDERDLAMYNESVPVVLVNGREVARYRLTHREFEAILARATSDPVR